MSRTVIYPALLSIFLITGCALSGKQAPPDSGKTSAERITVHGLSQDIIADAKESATAHCAEQDKQFTFLRNICKRKNWLGIEWLACDLYFACTREGEQPPVLPAHTAQPDEIIKEPPAPPAVDAACQNPPEKEKKPVAAVIQKQKQYPAFDQSDVGEPESLGKEPLGPGDAQSSTSTDTGITEEILN